MFPQDLTKLRFEEKEHKYSFEGKILPSVSTLVHLTTHPNRLQKWIRENKNRESVQKEIKRKTDVACRFGTKSHLDIENFIREHIKPGEIVTQKHPCLQVIAKMKKEAGTASLKKVEMIENAVKILMKYKIAYIALELLMYDEKGRYAGTADLVGIMNGRIVIVDWKTNVCTWSDFKLKKAEGYRMQLSTYSTTAGGILGIIAHVYTGNTIDVEQQEIKGWFEKFEKLIKLNEGKGKYRTHKKICSMWNDGSDMRSIVRSTKQTISTINSIVKQYQFFGQ